jgi:hypothetical protein
MHGLLIRGLWVRVPSPEQQRARYDGDARIARSFAADASHVRSASAQERIGERVPLGVEHVPVNVENAAEPCPITVCPALAMRRHVAYHDDPQGSSSACIRSIGFAGSCACPCDRASGSRETWLALLRTLS